MEWILLKGLVLRTVGLLVLLILTYLFWRGYTTSHHGSDARFGEAFAWFVAGITWALLVLTIAAVDEAHNFLPCVDLRPWVLRHVEIVWAPLIIASGRLLWVIAR